MLYPNQNIEYCLESPLSVFKNLSQKEKELISESHKLYNIKKGNLLFKEGDKPHGLICLASGKVKLFKRGVGKREQIVRLVSELGIIGYRSLFTDYTWHLSSEAIEDSTICLIEKNAIVKILKKNPEITFNFIKVLSEELIFSDNRIVSLTQKHTRGRVAESLLILRNTYGYEADGKTISVYMSREDIANMSSMTTSNAIRTLSNMASEGIIAIKGRKITIIELAKLESISEAG